MTNNPDTQPMVTEALEPCPFCGGEAQRFTIGADEPENAGGDVISCARCGASSHVEFGRKENLVDRWNQRHRQSSSNAGGVDEVIAAAAEVCGGGQASRHSVNRLRAALASLSTPTAEPMGDALTPSALSAKVVQPDFQAEVGDWMLECFGSVIAADLLERTDRFTEEALELAQTMPGFTAERAHALVDYVFSRPVGERRQEVGGVMVTLAALCNPVSINVTDEAERELARVWTKVEAIRAKQAAKPTGSALPVAVPSALSGDAGEGE